LGQNMLLGFDHILNDIEPTSEKPGAFTQHKYQLGTVVWEHSPTPTSKIGSEQQASHYENNPYFVVGPALWSYLVANSFRKIREDQGR